MRVDPRDPILQNRPPIIRRPKLRPVERTMFVLLSNPGEWFMIDRMPRSRGATTAMAQALRRRGFEVRCRHEGPMNHHYARWTHPVPTEVYEFEVPFE